jgi:uncharacterized RDD family membrane protein YckC
MPRSFIKTEETLIIETPERVPLAFALASIGNRFLAVAIDHFIQYLTILIFTRSFVSLAGTGNLTPQESPSQFFEEMPKWTIAVLIMAVFPDFFRLFYFI